MKLLLTTIAIALLPTIVFAQDAKKMKKHLTVAYTSGFDKTASISFDRTNPDKHGFDDISSAFKNAFISQKFTVSDNPQYILTMDYKYGYVISQYRMQYSNLTAQVLDLHNNKTVVATIVYDGKFELKPVAEAVAVELQKAAIPSATATSEKQNASKPKTKEEKLIELKNLFEKQLITKEEYEREKAKVLAEN
jgi:hypothetical protein